MIMLTAGFWYANGVAVSANRAFVAVVETNCFAVRRVWLSGPKVRRILLIHPSIAWCPPCSSPGLTHSLLA